MMEEGLVYIAGVNLNESLNVIWNGKTQCSITIPAEITESLKTSIARLSGSLTNKINNER
ncbi:hypothetical protein ACU42Y_16520 [Proteus mirabilis]